MVVRFSNIQRHYDSFSGVAETKMHQREIEVLLKRAKRREHIFLTIAMVTILVSLVVIYWGQDTVKSAKENPYPLIDLARNFIPQEDFIVNIQPLREDLNNLVSKEGPDKITLYFEFLNTGANIIINQNLKIWPASLAKLPLAMAVMKKVENGAWKLDDQLVLLDGDKDSSSGGLFTNSVGTAFTIERLLKDMLNNSDNTAYRILARNMNVGEFRLIVDEIGLDDFLDKQGKVSAKEYSRLFRALYTSSFLKRENSTKIITWLAETHFNRYLAASVPDSVTFSHKWGVNQDVHVFSDSGIVYVPNRPYIITVMIQGDQTEQEEEKVQKLMKTISDKIYRYVAQAQN